MSKCSQLSGSEQTTGCDMSLGEGDTTCDKVTQSVTRRHIASLVLSPFSWEYVTERQAYAGIYIPGKS